MHTETPTAQDFAQRKKFISSLDSGLAVVVPGGYMKDARPDNQFFPHHLYGTEVRTGRNTSYSLGMGIPETIPLTDVPQLKQPDQTMLYAIACLPLVGETPEQHRARLDRLGERQILEAFQEVLVALSENRSN